ncbi:MAG TPA: site-specific integrase, partial [Dictyobacter sp.]|nr:site-specific integrase [Dictyobacter sp.]
KRLEEGYSAQTVKHIHRLLHRALNDAVRWDLVTKNVCDRVDAPRVAKREMKAFTPQEAQSFLKAAQGDPLETLYILALTTGMRRGELLALKWEDINFKQEMLQVRRTIAHIPHQGFITAEPKTVKSRRSITLTTLAIEALKQHRAQQNEQRLKAGPAWIDQDWIFCKKDGTPIEPSTLLRRSFYPLLLKAEVPKIRFHDLRHSTASLLLSQGVHPKIVQELLGHSQISMTLDTYSHVLPSLQKEATDRLNTLLSKTV